MPIIRNHTVAQLWMRKSKPNGHPDSGRSLFPTRLKLLQKLPGLFLLPFLLFGLLSGCAIKRASYDVPELPLPTQFRSSFPSSAPVALPSLPAPSLQEAELNQWWLSLGSKELENLIHQGIANNTDLKIGTLRIAQAKTQLDQTQAIRFPTLDFSAAAGPQGGNTSSQTSSAASLHAGWKLDIWGEQAAMADSARFRLWQSVFDLDNTRRNLTANIANSYIDYLSLNDRLKVAQETETILSSLLGTMQKRVAAGDATLMDMEQHRAAILVARAQIPSLEQQREEVRNTLAFLLGTVPSSLQLSQSGLDSLHLPRTIPAVPSSLLLRRPDIRMQEARLLATDADIDTMRARILPSIDLSAQTGYSSSILSQLFESKSFFWTLFANVSASIFDAGKRNLDEEQARLIHEEMGENYVRTLYQAVREVESSLNILRQTQNRLELQQAATEASHEAWTISSKIYQSGGIDFMSLQETERSYHRYQDEYQHIQAERYHGFISLFQALGGGIDPASALPGKGKRPQDMQAQQEARLPSTWETRFHQQALPDTDYWQVELSGLYPQQSLESVWRDLLNRYPDAVSQKALYPQLAGQIDDKTPHSIAWYRLTLAPFASTNEAEQFCSRLKENQQRCQILSSRIKTTSHIKSTSTPARDKTNEPAANPHE